MNNLPRVGTTSRQTRSAGIFGREQQQQLGLQRVGILEFVDEQMREPLLKRGPHLVMIAHQIARADQQIEEIERTEPRLRHFIAIDRLPQFALQQRREIRVRGPLKRFQPLHQRLMRRNHVRARHALAVG